jgi:hypothetical protein
MSTPGFENLGVNGITQGRNQAVNSLLNFFYDELLGRSFRAGVNFQLVAAAAENVEGFVPDVAGGEYAKWKSSSQFSVLSSQRVLEKFVLSPSDLIQL